MSIGVHVLDDGRFEAEDLRPGDYQIRIALHEPPPSNACGWGRLIAAYAREFTVTGTADDSPLDLGPLPPVEVAGRSLKVGDAAPNFAIKTLDGKDLKLADFRGRVRSARLLGDLVCPLPGRDAEFGRRKQGVRCPTPDSRSSQ